MQLCLHRVWVRHLAVITLYTVLSLYVLGNVLPSFTTHLPGMGIAASDAWQNTWNMWWTKHALAQGINPYQTQMILYPYGSSLYIHPLNVVTTLLVLPMQLFFGPVAAYNSAVLMGFVLTGYGTYLLMTDVLSRGYEHVGAFRIPLSALKRGSGSKVNFPVLEEESQMIACFAGALVAFSPFHLARLADGHLSWVMIQWVPFYLLFLVRTLEDTKLRDALLSGIFLVLAALTSWYIGLYCMLLTGLLWLVRLPGALRTGTWRGELSRLLLIGLLTGLLLSPVLVPTVLEYRQDFQRGDDGWDRLVVAHSADLLDIVFPSHLHPLWGSAAANLHNTMRHGIWGWTITPGLTVLLLAGLGAWATWRTTWHWVLVLAALFMLALGPRLYVAGIDTDMLLPYELLAPIPGISTAYRPNHLIVVMLPMLALLAAYGLRVLLYWGMLGRWLAVIGVMLVVLEYAFIPLPAMPFDVHPVFGELRGQPGAVLELPLGHRSAAPMKSQMVHERPTIGGYLSRTPDIPVFMSRVPWMRELWELELRPPDIIPVAGDETHQVLSAHEICTLVLHPQHSDLAPGDFNILQNLIAQRIPAAEVTHDLPDIVVYNVPPIAVPRPLSYLGTGWQQRETDDGRIWRWMDTHATVHLLNGTGAARWVTLEMVAESYERTRPLMLALDDAPLGNFAMTREARMLRFQLVLPPGEHTLHLHSEADQAGNRSLSLSFSRIEIK